MTIAIVNSPRTFGGAVLKFEDRVFRSPIRREGSDIFFPQPWEKSSVVRTLNGGEQFLLAQGRMAFFGGMDEQPFVVQVEEEHHRRLVERGEEAFYAGLRPSKLDKYERLVGQRAVRQGDIWALPLGMSWEHLEEMWSCTSGHCQTLGFRQSVGMQVFGTRHTLTGRRTSRRARIRTSSGIIGLKGVTCEGTLSAPDHADLVLEGPHHLMRTPGIVEGRHQWWNIPGGD